MGATHCFHRLAAAERAGFGEELLPHYRDSDRRRRRARPHCARRQERILFLGGLALWIGLCTFGSQYARNWAAYSFVLSGYTVAIVGIPGALDAGNAFYIAIGRVTEISLGIIVAAIISHIILPNSLAASLRQAIADTRAELANYAIALLSAGGPAAPLRAKLLGQAMEIENSRASAIFEDREIRDRSDSLQILDAALINAVGTAQLLQRTLDTLGQTGACRP